MTDKTYKLLCDRVIIPVFKHYQKTHGGIIFPDYELKEIKSHYEDLIGYAKRHYMSNQEGLLNRHKVSAALMIAILKAKPIKKINADYYAPNKEGEPTAWPFNERLAITVALSVLRCFIDARVHYAFSGKLISKPIFEDVCKEDKGIFENGIPISKREREDWEWELYQIRQDGAYNILAIAHILSNLEKCARLEYFLKHKDQSPTYPDQDKLTNVAVQMLTLEQALGDNTHS